MDLSTLLLCCIYLELHSDVGMPTIGSSLAVKTAAMDVTAQMQISSALSQSSSDSASAKTQSFSAKISPNGYSERIINYGDSLCDCNVDVILNETTYPIVISN